MKKLYLKPSIKVIRLRHSGLLAGSDGRYATSVSSSESFTFDSSGIGEAEEDY
jgi:hypothetical protein